ncbi:MaoC family dehydratase [Ottowia sp. VDI28]|uniref:MaoC family dehydratase n=1 Tax=Ottowia sp. VDI28 TaxID=3133968 RepID=UPI003C2DCF2B
MTSISVSSLRIVHGLPELLALKGQHVGTSGWMAITPQMVQAFADSTGDRQWIHLDAERAAKESPFGGTIAHGFLTLSLLPALSASTLSVQGTRMSINYGLNRVRFTAPVRVGKRVRLHLESADMEPERDGSVKMTWRSTIEIENEAKPACVAETLAKYYF